jgi:hypothetical protein
MIVSINNLNLLIVDINIIIVNVYSKTSLHQTFIIVIINMFIIAIIIMISTI